MESRAHGLDEAKSGELLIFENALMVWRKI